MANIKKDGKGKDIASKRVVAEELYMSGQLSQERIADMLGISSNTITNWVRKYNWKVIKGAAESSRGKIVTNTLLRIVKITEESNEATDGKLAASRADEVLKLTKVVEFFSPNKISVSGQVETMKSFLAYLYDEDHALAKMVAEHSQAFIQISVNNAIQ